MPDYSGIACYRFRPRGFLVVEAETITIANHEISFTRRGSYLALAIRQANIPRRHLHHPHHVDCHSII